PRRVGRSSLPTRRSSDLSKSQLLNEVYPEELPMLLKRIEQDQRLELASRIDDLLVQLRIAVAPHLKNPGPEIARISRELIARRRDRKSTRLNSSHVKISY